MTYAAWRQKEIRMRKYSTYSTRNIPIYPMEYPIANEINEIISNEFPYDITILAENLAVPWALDISEEGKIYVTERNGAVRVIEDGILDPSPLIRFGGDFVSSVEGGLMGLALDPNFSQNNYFYVAHTYRQGNQLYVRVVRLIDQGDKAVIDRTIIEGIPGSQTHTGGRIKIGPDNKLYIGTGDAGNPRLSQDVNSLAGKILRLELDGSIPEDNPFPGSPVFSLGFCNPQGMTWKDSIMYASEHGEIGNDEINLIKPGANYGWPRLQTDSDFDMENPLVGSGGDAWAPSGIAYINQGPWQGRLLVAALKAKQLLAFTLNQEGTGVEQVEAFLWNEFGRLRDVVQAKDGSIYIATSNRDGRDRPATNDDRILRLTPKASVYESGS